MARYYCAVSRKNVGFSLFKRATAKPIFHGIVLTWCTAAARTIVQNPARVRDAYVSGIRISHCIIRTEESRGVSRSTGSPAAVSR